ncbi:unnamed protein product [Candidula unifasciata]|uniref:BHLH domain-containing protein n=1 Tax=Candidula unifasciata TaxID=100452 RepID=A0A8S4A7A0_9EUPU|nr:unnamed protein product [Candidula unifasciata]
MEMPVPVHVNRFVNSYYGDQFKEVPYSGSYVSACSDFGTHFQGQENSFKNNNNISIYSNSSCNIRSSFHFAEEEADLLELGQNCLRNGEIIESPSLHIGDTRLGSQEHNKKLDPYSPLCMVPLPGHLIETNFIRRRNERERERVRCVNEGYDRLKEHLPIVNKDRRISKVETLRRAIEYIRELQTLLEETEATFHSLSNSCSDETLLSQRRKT